MGRSRSAASPTTGRSPASRPRAIARSSSSTSAPTAATWPPRSSPAGPEGLGHRSARGRRDRPGPRLGQAARFSPDSRRIASVPRTESSSSTTWRPAGSSGPGRASCLRRPSVPTAPRSRPSTTNRPRLPDLRSRSPAGWSGRSRCGPAEMHLAWSPDGRTLATRATTSRSTSGTPRPAPGGRPSRAIPKRTDRLLPPRRHAAGQQRLGRPAPALGPDPGPAPLERDRQRGCPNSARTDGSSSRSRTN